jgi:hypothetical protein
MHKSGFQHQALVSDTSAQHLLAQTAAAAKQLVSVQLFQLSFM